MNSLRRVFCFSMAIMIAAFALPGLAAPQNTKQYSLAMTSPAELKVVATLTNVSPDGNSNISSYKFTITSGNAKINPDPTKTKLTQQDPRKVGVVTVDASQTSVTVTGIQPLKPGQPAVILTIALFDCGSDIKWDAIVWTGQTSGQTFAPDTPSLLPITTSVTCGTIACAATDVPVPSSFYTATVTRGAYDKDGINTVGAGLCETVPYTVTVQTVLSKKQQHFEWPVLGAGSDERAAFKYVVNATPLFKQVGWLPITGSATFISGPRCLAPPAGPQTMGVLPAPYGALLAGLVGSYIEVNTTGGVVARPAALTQFDVVIGTERLTVHYDSTAGIGADGVGPNGGELWFVDARNVGMTPVGGPYTPTTLTPGDPVVYTPLPLLPGVDPVTLAPLPTPASPYAINMQAQMCIVEFGATSTTYIDIGDGWASQP